MQHTPSFFNTLQQLRRVPLSVRTATLGINISDCSDRQLNRLCEGVYQRILSVAGRFSAVCGEVAGEYGIPILQRRLQVTPIDRVVQGYQADDLVHVARTLDGAAANVHCDRIGGFVADVQHGLTSGARQMIASLPAALSQTERVRAAVHVGSTQSGINMEAISLVAQKIKDVAQATAERRGDGAGKLAVLANDAAGHPHLTNACLGDGWGDVVLHVGIGAASIVRQVLQDRLRDQPRLPLQEMAGEIQTAVFQASRAAEFVGREIARRLGAEFGTVDVTLAPTVRAGDSVVDILKLMGIEQVGGPGTAAALALLAGAVRRGGGFGSTAAGGYARVVLSVLEDLSLSSMTLQNQLTIEQLAMLAPAGSGGLDLVPLPGDTSAETLAALIADQVALAVVNDRPCAVRVIPVPGGTAGERVNFGNSRTDAHILSLGATAGATHPFLEHGGRIPGPG